MYRFFKNTESEQAHDIERRLSLRLAGFADQSIIPLDDKEKHFISALKDNRLVALNERDKREGRFPRIDELELSDDQAVRGWLKGYSEEVLFVRQVLAKKDGGAGVLNLVCSDLVCDGETVATFYKKRWKVEVFHKSLKSNAALAKSSTRRVTAKSNQSSCRIHRLQAGALEDEAQAQSLRLKRESCISRRRNTLIASFSCCGTLDASAMRIWRRPHYAAGEVRALRASGARSALRHRVRNISYLTEQRALSGFRAAAIRHAHRAVRSLLNSGQEAPPFRI
jgi:hypothetical protein